MYSLKNNGLEVQILDPSIDRKLLGSRYCTGGYIFQINDKKKGALLSGPQFPNPNFDVFHGQCAPEVFTTVLNENAAIGQEVLAPGIGLVEKTSSNIPFSVRDNPIVKEFCSWDIERDDQSISMNTLHKFRNWKLIINRQVTLIDKIISSNTTVENRGQNPVSIRWFAHPFFPLPINSICCIFSTPFSISTNEGYFVNNQGFIEMKPEYDWKKGLFQKIVCSPSEKFSAIQCHPKIGRISIECDYIPASLAIWGNDKTFSIEPFHETTIEVNDKRTWSIRYCFGGK